MSSALANTGLICGVLLGMLCAIGGCQAEYRADSRTLDRLWTSGDYAQAAHVAYLDARQESSHSKNRVIYFLEAGRAAQAAGDYPSSIEAFDHAFVDTFPYLDESPEATVSEAIVTTVGNDTMSIYRGTPNDRIMLHTFNALNFMAMGDMHTARVELNRAMLWQDDAHHRYARAIELAGRRNADAVSAATDKWNDRSDSGWSSDSNGVMHGNTRRIMAQHYEDLPDKAAYANYGNPFASHLDGVFRLAIRGYGGDLPAARTGLRNVASMVPELVPVVGSDIVQASPDGGPLPPTTWVYFLTGQSPEYEEVRITMPLALSGGFTMPTLALPRLVPNTDMIPWLQVRTDDHGSRRSRLLANTADVASWQFKERLPIIISQEAIRATGKAVAAWAAMRFASEQQNLAASLLALGTVIYQVGSAQADLRCWHTMPAEIQVVRMPTPASGVLQLSTPDGRDLGTARVRPDESNILVVSMPSNAAMTPSLMPIQLTGERPPWVATFDLHADPDAGDVETPNEPLLADTHTDKANVDESSREADHAVDDTQAAPHEAPSLTVGGVDTNMSQDTSSSEAPSIHPQQAHALTVDQVDAPTMVEHPSAGALKNQPVQERPTEFDTLETQDSVAPPTEMGVESLDMPSQHEQETSASLYAAAPPQTSNPDAPTQTDAPRQAHSNPPATNTRHAVKGVKLTWGQAMSWHPNVEHMLKTRITLQPTATGYTAYDGSETALVTSPSALLNGRPVWMHRDALVAMSNAITRAMTEAGYVGTRVYPALDAPDQLRQHTLHFVVFLPVDAANASLSWPDGLTAVPHPTLPVLPPTPPQSQHMEGRPPRKPFQPAPGTAPVPQSATPDTAQNAPSLDHDSHGHDHAHGDDNAVIDIDAVDDHPGDAPEPTPTPTPKSSTQAPTVQPIDTPGPVTTPANKPFMEPRPVLPAGPYAVNAIKATWARPMDWYPDLQALLDVPIRLRSAHTGYHAHDGAGPLIVSTPSLLVARQPAWLHADAMHTMGRAVQAALVADGFVETSVHPACTKPDARGFVELHLIVLMPLEGTTAPNTWPDHLTRVPNPAPKSTPPPEDGASTP